MDAIRHLERHQVRILWDSRLLTLTRTPESLFLARLALPESVHYRIFFPSREALHECISPSSLPQGKALYSLRRETFRFISFQSTEVFFLFFRRSPISWTPRSTQLQRLRSHHHFHRWKRTAAHYPHNFRSRAVLGMRVTAGSHHSHKSLRDRVSILSTATQSVPHPTRRRLPHYLTYATAVGGSVT